MRILFLHEVNYLTKPIFEMHEFPEHLAKLGHEVGFVQFPESYSPAQIKERGYRKRIPGRVVAGVELELFTPWTPSGNFLGRLIASAISYWQFGRILKDFKPDVVVSFSVPTSGWQALLACKRAGVPYVFRALDVSHKIRKGLFSALVKQAERFIYRNADALSANNPAMITYVNSIAGKHVSGTVHNPPLDLTMFVKGSRSEGRKKLGLGDSEQVILYLGSFFYFSGLDSVIREMSGKPSDSLLVLVGGGEQDAELRGLVADLNLDNRVIFTGMRPFEELPDLVAAADVAINPMEKTLVSNAALPNKVLQYMAAGVPVVSTSLDGLVATFGAESGIVWGDSPREVAKLALSDSDSEALTTRSVLQRAAIRKFKDAADPALFADFLSQVRANS